MVSVSIWLEWKIKLKFIYFLDYDTTIYLIDILSPFKIKLYVHLRKRKKQDSFV
jgi:hypothetical protein